MSRSVDQLYAAIRGSFGADVPDWRVRVIAASLRYLGLPYKWGAGGPGDTADPVGLDCSGLVGRVLADAGVVPARAAEDRTAAGWRSYAQRTPTPTIGGLAFIGEPVSHVEVVVLGLGAQVITVGAQVSGGVGVRVSPVSRWTGGYAQVVPS